MRCATGSRAPARRVSRQSPHTTARRPWRMKVRILKSVLGAACEELRVWGQVPFGKLARRDVEDGLALPNPEDSNERVTHLRSL
jgi:hypothetical protein